jgi:hypothetical protein
VYTVAALHWRRPVAAPLLCRCCICIFRERARAGVRSRGALPAVECAIQRSRAVSESRPVHAFAVSRTLPGASCCTSRRRYKSQDGADGHGGDSFSGRRCIHWCAAICKPVVDGSISCIGSFCHESSELVFTNFTHNKRWNRSHVHSLIEHNERRSGSSSAKLSDF